VRGRHANVDDHEVGPKLAHQVDQLGRVPALTRHLETGTLEQAGEKSGEKMWRFPLIDDYREGLRSTVADIKNTGPRTGGAINAAKFFHFFVEDTPWAHIDMAGTDESDKEKGIWVKGSTGIPTRRASNSQSTILVIIRGPSSSSTYAST